MTLDLKHLQKDFLNKNTRIRRTGSTTDLLVCIVQSCEVQFGNYCLLTNTLDEGYKLIPDIIEITHLVTNLNIISVDTKYKTITFSNGSKIYFELERKVHFNNLYFDINNLTSNTKICYFKEAYADFACRPMPEKILLPPEHVMFELEQINKNHYGYNRDKPQILQEFRSLIKKFKNN